MHKPLCAIVVASAIASMSVGYTKDRGPIESELELSHERFYAIKAEITRTPNAVIVLGDSIVQGAPLPKSICGYAVINAGVVGAAVEYFERHAAELLGSSRPRLIVLAVGINDASPKMAKQFRLRYRKTVASLSRVAPVAVATITPVRSGNGSAGYDAQLVPGFNDAIKTTPNVKAVINLNKPLSGANWTTDGIHFGHEGHAFWTKALVDAVGDELGCTKQ
jgi:GDSL-like Lipase/Acylhydrolase family